MTARCENGPNLTAVDGFWHQYSRRLVPKQEQQGGIFEVGADSSENQHHPIENQHQNRRKRRKGIHYERKQSYDTGRKEAIASPASPGGSRSPAAREGEKGPNAEADSGGCDPGERRSLDCQYRIGRAETCPRGEAEGFVTSDIFPKGALTHHSPTASGGIPPAGRAVRSPRGTRRLRTPFSQYRCARLAGQLAYVSQRSAWLHHAGAQTHLASCGRKPATGRFPAWRTKNNDGNGGDAQ